MFVVHEVIVPLVGKEGFSPFLHNFIAFCHDFPSNHAQNHPPKTKLSAPRVATLRVGITRPEPRKD